MTQSLKDDCLYWATHLPTNFMHSSEIKFFYLFRSELMTLGYSPDIAALLALKCNVYTAWADEDDDFLGDLASKLGESYGKALDQLRAMNLSDKHMTDPIVDKLFFQPLRPDNNKLAKTRLTL